MTDYRELREAAEGVLLYEKLYGGEDSHKVDSAEAILSILNALAASEAKVEKAREALTSLKEYVGSSQVMLETEIISRIDTTLKDIA